MRDDGIEIRFRAWANLIVTYPDYYYVDILGLRYRMYADLLVRVDGDPGDEDDSETP